MSSDSGSSSGSNTNWLRLLALATMFACILLYLAFQGSPELSRLLQLCLLELENNDLARFRECVEYFYSPGQPASDEPPTPTPTTTPSPIPTDTNLGINIAACLDENQLLVSIQFDRSVTGEVSFSLATTSPDYVLQTIFTKLENHWDFVIPNISFPEGSNIHGGIVYIPDDASPVALSQLVYDLKVAGCGTEPTATPSPTPNPDGIPVIINSQCLNPQQLMIVFDFQQPVTGLYALFVNGAPYQIAPVPDQPDRLFFFGSAPPGGGMPSIVLQSLPDGTPVLEIADYSVPQCDFQSPNNPGGGDDYVPPPPPPGDS